MNGQLRRVAYNLPRTKDTFSGQVHYLETGANECLLLRDGELKEPVLEQGIGNENLMGQLQKSIQQRRFPEVGKTSTITDNDPHPTLAALSNRPRPQAQ